MYIAIACAVIAFPLMITGAVYSQYAADDPRTPMVNQYNTAVNNWQNTERAEYAAKYATSSKIPALSVTRGNADSGSVTSTTGFQAIMTGEFLRNGGLPLKERIDRAHEYHLLLSAGINK